MVKRNYAKIFRIDCWKNEDSSYWGHFIFEAIYIMKCWTHCWFHGLKRTAWHWYTGSRQLTFLKNRFFRQRLTYTAKIREKFWFIRILVPLKSIMVKTWNVTKMIICCVWMLRVTARIMHIFVKNKFLKNVEVMLKLLAKPLSLL